MRCMYTVQICDAWVIPLCSPQGCVGHKIVVDLSIAVYACRNRIVNVFALRKERVRRRRKKKKRRGQRKEGTKEACVGNMMCGL